MALDTLDASPVRATRQGMIPKLERIPPKVRATILSRIRDGVPGSVAAVSCGISRRTFQRWLEKGRCEDAREPYRTFAADADRAFAEWQVAAVQSIDEAGLKDWRARMTLLAVRNSEEFADKTRVKHEHAHEHQVKIDVVEAGQFMQQLAERIFGTHPRFGEFERGLAEIVEGDAVEAVGELAA